MLSPRAAGIQGRPTRSPSFPGTPQHPGSSHPSSSSRNTSWDVRGQQNPTTMSGSGKPQGKTGFSNSSLSNSKSWGWWPCTRGVLALCLPQQPHHGSPRWGRSDGCWWHSPPGAQGDAVLMASPAAAPPRRESLGQQLWWRNRTGMKPEQGCSPPKPA